MRRTLRTHRATFLRFCAVGGGGFLCDAGILTILLHLGWNPYMARLVSIAFALCLTWWLNRRFTFRMEERAGWREFLLYQTVNGIGAVINYSVYGLLLHFLAILPWLALGIGSAVALLFNFIGNLTLTFAKRR